MFEMTMIFETLTIALPATLGRTLMLVIEMVEMVVPCAGHVALI
jgi:hypothetical protein